MAKIKIGTTGENVVASKAKDDVVVVAIASESVVAGGNLADLLVGGNDNDTLLGGNGNDILSGDGAGPNVIDEGKVNEYAVLLSRSCSIATWLRWGMRFIHPGALREWKFSRCSCHH